MHFRIEGIEGCECRGKSCRNDTRYACYHHELVAEKESSLLYSKAKVETSCDEGYCYNDEDFGDLFGVQLQLTKWKKIKLMITKMSSAPGVRIALC